jgi:two-component system, CitB family, sensor kinase
MSRVSLARQLLLLQLLVVAVALAVAGAVVIRAAQDRTDDGQRDRVLSVARTLAVSDEVRRALRTERPTTLLQPLAEATRQRSDLGFVVFMTPDGTRFSHPDERQIGRRYIGDIAAARRGRDLTETRTGTLGPSVRAVVPIRDGGRITGLVAVGVLEEAISEQVERQLPGLLLAFLLALGIGTALTLLLARRVRRQTRGLDPRELALLYEHHEAVLHAMREGVVVVGSDGRLLLANAEARRLLDIDDDAVDRPIGAVVANPELAGVLAGGEDDAGVHVVGSRVLVTAGRTAAGVGTVTTLRDRTELEGLLRELTTVRGMADALRAQAHESANELHTVVGLVELGRYEDAIAFATRRIGITQNEVDLVQARIGDPTLAALLLAKASACRERGVELVLDAASELPEGAVPGDELVTIVGNLVDNALDALADQTGGRIEVRAGTDGETVTIVVRDNGPGIPDDAIDRVFDAGWSTKPGTGSRQRGLGLALVAAAVGRLAGKARAANDGGAVFVVELPAATREPATTP